MLYIDMPWIRRGRRGGSILVGTCKICGESVPVHDLRNHAYLLHPETRVMLKKLDEISEERWKNIDRVN